MSSKKYLEQISKNFFLNYREPWEVDTYNLSHRTH